MDHFTIAHDVTLDMAQNLVESGLSGEKVAESFIAVGLSLWVAQPGCKERAEIVLQAFEEAHKV